MLILKKHIKLLFFISLLVFFKIVSITPKASQDPKHKSLNFAILIDNSNNVESKFIKQCEPGAITEDLIRLISTEFSNKSSQNKNKNKNISKSIKVITVASISLLKNIVYLTEQNNQKWGYLKKYLADHTIFFSKLKQFVILAPKNLKLEIFGLKSLDLADIINLLKTEKISYKSQISDLILLLGSQTFKNSTKKVYLTGHGKPHYVNGGTVSGFSIDQYKRLIKYFSTINCKFLFINSCFAGDLNLTNAHYNRANYPVILGNITNNIQDSYKVDFRSFFLKLDSLFKKNQPKNSKKAKKNKKKEKKS